MGKRENEAKAVPSAREVKLAQALRANLRRRKVGPEPKAVGKADPEGAKPD